MGVCTVVVAYRDLLVVDPVCWRLASEGLPGCAFRRTAARRGRNGRPKQILAPSLLLSCSG